MRPSTRHLQLAGVSIAATLTLTLTGCSDDPGDGLGLQTPSTSTTPSPPTASPTTAAPTTTSPTGTATPSLPPEAQQILAQYRKFFPLLRELGGDQAADRGPKLAAVATKPLYDTVLANLAKNDAEGIAFYGPPAKLLPRITAITGDVAIIEDCQDGSQGGTKRKSDGQLLTVGRKGSAVTATVARGSDHIWRVSSITRQGKDVPC